ncbi:MAG: ATPase domain-containing protein [Desulfurococcaceae archaeon]
MPGSYTTGSRDLDELLGGLPPNTLILVAGHPGSGKTTFASHVCYSNTLDGGKCLYITFYEDKEKLFRNMSKLGIDLFEAEEKGLVKFIKLPVTTMEEALNAISGLLAKETYDVVVVDSINPILEVAQPRELHRAILLNFFYQLTNMIKGVFVVVAEVPLDKETPDYRALEFTADIVIYLKHRIEHGLLSRIMEIRKVRGAQLIMNEVPFMMIEGEGIRVFIPPKPARLLTGKVKTLNTSISVITKMIGTIKMGDIIHISYPPHGRSPLVLVPLIDLAVTNNSKTLFISFTYSPDELRDLITGMLKNYFEIDPELSNKIINKYFYLVSYNPAAYSITYLNGLLIELIEDIDPDIVAIHGTEVFSAISRDVKEFWVLYRNLLIWLKNNGKLVILYSARVDPYWTRLHESQSDAVARIYMRHVKEGLKYVFYAWMRGSDPKTLVLTERDLVKYSPEARILADLVKRKVDQ